jgi:hypothetical protein
MWSVLVTGSRAWTDEARIRAELDSRLAEHGELHLIHGACSRGADLMADRWGRERERVVVDRYPARWGEHSRAAGHIRNLEMVALHPDECLAFIHEASKGASHCATAAARAGIPTRVFRSWGGGAAIPREFTFTQPSRLY